MPGKNTCPFCDFPPASILDENSLCLGIRDAFPVSLGHTLIVPRRHVASFFELTSEERTDMLALLGRVIARLDAEFHPSGYNIGLNEGAAAGQTIMHVHLHVIPRYRNDVDDPRGGVRWVIPSKARYWEDR